MLKPLSATGEPLRKLSLFGHFGSSNPGNESTLQATLWQLRSSAPRAELRCICSDPEVVRARDRIDAVAITTRDARIWDTDVAPLPRVRACVSGLTAEAAQWSRALRELRDSDALIVPGTGLVTDAYGLASWGPYNQLKWVLAAKLRGIPVLFVSVGAGPLDRALGRGLVRLTMSLADYRSFRDEPSRACVAQTGFAAAARDPIYPDLAFGLPTAALPPAPVRSEDARPVVGLGLMEYPGRYSSSDPRPETYARYLDALATFAQWLLERRYDIRLLLGDADTIAIDQFRSVLRDRAGDYDERRVTAQPITSVQDVLSELAASDFVVATRFHNVLLAMVLDKPVIAISFHHKCAALMAQIGLTEYCHDIHRIDPEVLIAQFRRLERNRSAVKETIARGTDDARGQLEQQFTRLFGEPSRRRVSDRRRLRTASLRVGERAWRRLPARVRDTPPARFWGTRAHAQVRRHADREMYLGTLFLRNRPALELIRRIVGASDCGAPVNLAVLGCSIGAEVYSIAWTLRRARPDLDLRVHALDIAPAAVDVARRGVYSPAESEFVNASIFDALTADERREMFDWDGDEGSIKPWLRAGVSWQVGDASDPGLIAALGRQDLVVANNFLCHMPVAAADRCLRNFAGLVTPGGHLFVSGVDLEVRSRAARDLGWRPVADLRAEIHDGDRLVRADWPWRWWGLEPLDRSRPDWETRYSAVFQI